MMEVDWMTLLVMLHYRGRLATCPWFLENATWEVSFFRFSIFLTATTCPSTKEFQRISTLAYDPS